jgi:hypothetical protein
MESSSPTVSEKPEEQRVQDATPVADLETNAANQLPARFAHLDEKKILRKVGHLLSRIIRL